MKLLVATDLTAEQVQNFMQDFYELDSSRMTSVTVIPEREKSVKLNRGISFCVILSAVCESIAEYLRDYTLSEENNAWLVHRGHGGIFKPMEENEVRAMQFIEDNRFETLKRQPRKHLFGWCDDLTAQLQIAQDKRFSELERIVFND